MNERDQTARARDADSDNTSRTCSLATAIESSHSSNSRKTLADAKKRRRMSWRLHMSVHTTAAPRSASHDISFLQQIYFKSPVAMRQSSIKRTSNHPRENHPARSERARVSLGRFPGRSASHGRRCSPENDDPPEASPGNRPRARAHGQSFVVVGKAAERREAHG